MRGLMKTQKAIAPFVILTFLFTILAVSQPISATDNVKISASAEEDHPGAVEAPQRYVKRKSSPIVPIIIGLVLVGGAAAVLFLVILKNKYDITGVWNVSFTWSGSSTGHKAFTFSGDKKSGNFAYDGVVKGTYTVSGKNVEWVFPSGTKYTGTFTDKNTMSGTMIDYNSNTGTWSATRMGATSINHPTQSLADPEGNRQK